jgi:hypothetical protein
LVGNVFPANTASADMIHLGLIHRSSLSRALFQIS